MHRRRLTLAAALLLSVLLHLMVLGGGELTLPDFYTAPDEVLASHTPMHVQRVHLAARPPLPARKAAAGMRLASPRPAKHKPPQPPAPQVATTDAAPVDTAVTPASGAETDPTTAPEAPPAPEEALPAARPELAPAFPVQLSAELEAHVNGLSATLHQTWIMEGYRYAIEVQGSRFGYRARISSEGQVSPEGGLSPERSSLTLGGKVKSQTEYANGTLRMGKPDSLKDYPLPIVPQDFASLPFHLAVTFNGQPQTLFVSTGRRLYQTRFTLVAEETLQLPVGTLRALHVAGERYDYERREMVPAIDVWLAPDYLNFPIKVSGHLSGGEPIDYRVRFLEIEGKPVLGARGGAEPVAPGEAIPEWLRERSQVQGLKNP